MDKLSLTRQLYAIPNSIFPKADEISYCGKRLPAFKRCRVICEHLFLLAAPCVFPSNHIDFPHQSRLIHIELQQLPGANLAAHGQLRQNGYAGASCDHHLDRHRIIDPRDYMHIVFRKSDLFPVISDCTIGT